MSGFRSGLELAILSFVLLFSWLAVAVYASAELAFAVGLGVVAIWFLFFVPSGAIKELIWQARQKKIMQQAMSQTPMDYRPGSALPPPQSGTGLSVVDSPSGSAIDIYRDDMPQLLPQLEPRSHAYAFKRSLVLPVLGSLMMIGASNDTFMSKLLEARGMMQKLPIEWEELRLPEQYLDKRGELEQAAREAVRREAGCAKLLSGTIAPVVQFRPPAEQTAQIDKGEYVYEFQCQPALKDAAGHLVWIAPDEMGRGSFASLMSQLTRHPTNEQILASCNTAANEALKPLNATIMPVDETQQDPKAEFFFGRMPYADHTRVVTVQRLARANGAVGKIGVSCWVNSEGVASVRFAKAPEEQAN